MTIAARLERYDWAAVRTDLDANGWARLPRVLGVRPCDDLRRCYDRDDTFRSTVHMERVRFGRGEYRYFGYPLPPLVAELRQHFYRQLAPIASEWQQRQGAAPFPARLEEFLAECHRGGQTRPTPLLLRYRAGDYNRLHQDVYGAIGFPLQVLIVLSREGVDYEGGEVVLVSQRPRMQSQATVLRPAQGEALIFTNRSRPVPGQRGFYSEQMRHGASAITRGERMVLGVIFHDAS